MENHEKKGSSSQEFLKVTCYVCLKITLLKQILKYVTTYKQSVYSFCIINKKLRIDLHSLEIPVRIGNLNYS